MSGTGIGASVRRKEDHRFITGRATTPTTSAGPGQAFAYFIRSPHAHATIKSIDAKAAPGLPGVLGGAHRRRACRRQDRQSDLRLDDPFQGRLADENGGASGARHRQGLPCRRCRRGGDRRDAGAGARRRRESQSRLRGAARRRRSGGGAKTGRAANPRHRAEQHHLSMASRRRQSVDAAFKSAKHVTKLDIVNNRLVPNAIEPRAAIGDYDSGTGTLTLWNTTQNPHVARLVIAAFVGMAPEHKLRVIAPDVGGGFGSKIFIYPEEVVALWASKQVGRPVKWASRSLGSFLTDAHGRDHVTHAEMAFDGEGKITALRAKTIANLGAYMSTFSSSVPTYLYAHAAVGPVRHPADLLRSRRRLYQHRAGRRLSRRGAPGSDLRGRAAGRSRRPRVGTGPRRTAAQEFRAKIPAPDAGHHALRRRRL